MLSSNGKAWEHFVIIDFSRDKRNLLGLRVLNNLDTQDIGN
jgi:hypothetical protein